MLWRLPCNVDLDFRIPVNRGRSSFMNKTKMGKAKKTRRMMWMPEPMAGIDVDVSLFNT